MEISPSGTPYVAYTDRSIATNKATVMAYSGAGGWQAVGTAGFSAGAALNPSLAINSSGTPYVAYEDASNNPSTATVMEYSGGSWQVVGTAGFSSGTAEYTSLAFSATGVPFVAYVDVGNNYNATVMVYK